MTGPQKATLRPSGPPILTLWAWVVIDEQGNEAICRSPWSETSPLVGPDAHLLVSLALEMFCRALYEPHGWKVELRRFEMPTDGTGKISISGSDFPTEPD